MLAFYIVVLVLNCP